MTPVSHRLKDGFLKHVKSSGLQGDANGLLVHAIIQATLEHLVDNAFETWVNDFLLLIFWQFSILHPQLSVMVNALGYSSKKKKKEFLPHFRFQIIIS